MRPSSSTSRKRALSAPACGTTALWNFSEPARDCRHWNHAMVSAPRATWARASRIVWPGALAWLVGCQLTALVECSMSIHGAPPARPRVRSPLKASSARGCCEGVDDVVVGADDVDRRGPLGVVEVAEVLERHEVRRDGHARRELVEHGALAPHVVEQRVGAEALVVEHVRRVVEGRRAARRQDLLPVGVALAPEGGAPRLVERLERVVAPAQPRAEVARALVAVAGQVVAGVLVGDVPHREAGVVVVAGRQLPRQREGVLAEDGGGGAPRLPAAGRERVPVDVDGQDLRVGGREPRRRGRRRRREVDGDAAGVQLVHDRCRATRSRTRPWRARASSTRRCRG